jgi:4'-phosphopantetheinyl transferase
MENLLSIILAAEIPAFMDSKAWIMNVHDFYPEIDLIKQCLPQEELNHGVTMKNPEYQSLYYLRKGITRMIHSSFLKTTPDSIRYEYTENGKPNFADMEYQKFGFNISHSKEYLMAGIAKGREIGADIEKINLKLKFPLMTDSVFSPRELDLYRNYHELRRIRAFYKAWVQKEAIGKALGLGLSIGFNNIPVNIDPDCNDLEYDLRFDHLGCAIRIKVKLEQDYAWAIACLN